jgi:hypothetical protein
MALVIYGDSIPFRKKRVKYFVKNFLSYGAASLVPPLPPGQQHLLF